MPAGWAFVRDMHVKTVSQSQNSGKQIYLLFSSMPRFLQNFGNNVACIESCSFCRLFARIFKQMCTSIYMRPIFPFCQNSRHTHSYTYKKRQTQVEISKIQIYFFAFLVFFSSFLVLVCQIYSLVFVRNRMWKTFMYFLSLVQLNYLTQHCFAKKNWTTNLKWTRKKSGRVICCCRQNEINKSDTG